MKNRLQSQVQRRDVVQELLKPGLDFAAEPVSTAVARPSQLIAQRWISGLQGRAGAAGRTSGGKASQAHNAGAKRPLRAAGSAPAQSAARVDNQSGPWTRAEVARSMLFFLAFILLACWCGGGVGSH